MENQENWLNYYQISSKSNNEQYLYSLYWAINTMILVGNGDILPQNGSEIVFSIFVVLIGVILFCYNLNKIGRIFHEMFKDKQKFNDKISKITCFMENKNININLQTQIRAYLKFIWESQNEQINEEILNIINSLSHNLKEELYIEGYGIIIRNHPLFSDHFSKAFICSLSQQVEEEIFMKNELIFEKNGMNQNLYFIKSGEIEVFHHMNTNHPPIIFKKIKEKDSFGEYSFITGLNHIYSTRASEYTTVYKIKRDSFLTLLKSHPSDYQKFFELRDRIILYNDLSSLNIRCSICDRKNHFNNRCNLTHYIPQRENILLSHISTQNQERLGYKRRNKRTYNALLNKKNLIKIATRLHFFQSNEIIGSAGEYGSSKTDEDDCSAVSFDDYLDTSQKKKSPPSEEFIYSPRQLENMTKEKKNKEKICENFDICKNYEFYFPEQNVENFILKYKKIRKQNMKKAHLLDLITHMKQEKFYSENFKSHSCREQSTLFPEDKLQSNVNNTSRGNM